MATIPIVAGTFVAHAGPSAAPMDLGAALAPSAAQAQFGQTLTQAGSVAMEMAQRMQAAKNLADATTGRLDMQKAQSDYQNEMATNQDESTWAPNWQKKLSDIKTDIVGNPDLAPVVRATLNNQFNEFAQTSSSQIQTQQNVRTIQRQKARMMNVADTMWDNGDYEKGAIAVDAMESHGLINSDDKVQILKKGQVQVDFANVQHAAATDPVTALESLQAQTDDGKWTNYPNLDENQRSALTNKVETQVNKLKQETLQDLYDRQNGGEVLGTKELQGLVDDGSLNASAMKGILRAQARAGASAVDLQAYSQLLGRVDKYNPADDKGNNYSERTAIIDAMAHLPETYRAEVKSQLDRRENSTGEASKTTDAFDYLRHVVQLGTLGNTSIIEGVPVNRTQAEQAYKTEATLRDQLTRQVQATPNMSTADQIDWIGQKIRTQQNRASGLPLVNAMSGTAPSPQRSTQTPEIGSAQEMLALPHGTVFKSKVDGKFYTAP